MLWWIKATRRLGLTPMARHGRWTSESGVHSGDRSIHEHELISHTIELAITVDQLNVASLVSFELMLRRLQLIEEAHSLTPGAPSYEGSEHWMGQQHPGRVLGQHNRSLPSLDRQGQSNQRE